MANVNLAKPSTQGTPIISCSVFGTGGTVFYYKCASARPTQTMRVERVTGDGDDAQSWEADYMPDFDITMSGWMIAASVNANVVTFVSSFKDSTKNPLTASFGLKLATNETLNIPKGLMWGWGMEYDRARGVLPMVLRIKATDSNVTLT